jgi:hypothetical protein
MRSTSANDEKGSDEPPTATGAVGRFREPGQRISTPVVAAGLLSSGAALLAVFYVNRAIDGFSMMGWYAYYVFPVGATLVGVAAGSGYGIASWRTGARISAKMLWTVLLLQIIVYFAAQYVQYRHLVAVFGEEIAALGFWGFFDAATRAVAFRHEHGGAGSPLGAVGYVFRMLEIGGFSLGALAIPGLLRMRPYCRRCHLYMRSRRLGLIPAGDRGERASPGHGFEVLESLRDSGRRGDREAFTETLDAHRPHKKEYRRHDHRIAISMSVCPRCGTGQLTAWLLTGRSEATKRTSLGTTRLDQKIVNAVWE